MKKVNYLFGILILMITLACSCEKENVTPDPPDEGLITLAELNGSWKFQRYVYQGTDYTNANAPADMNDIFFDQKYVKSNMTWENGGGFTYNFSKDVNKIEIWYQNNPAKFKFTVTSYVVNNENNDAELHLRVDHVKLTYNYLGGELVLTK